MIVEPATMRRDLWGTMETTRFGRAFAQWVPWLAFEIGTGGGKSNEKVNVWTTFDGKNLRTKSSTIGETQITTHDRRTRM